MEISSRLLLIVGVVILAVVLAFMLRGCKQINIKQKNTDQKTTFRVDIEKEKPQEQ